jgi:serine/threonine protein kinase
MCLAAGSQVKLIFSLQYAPPEFVRAVQARAESVVAAGAVDVWALGVIAFELLAGTPVFPPGTPAKAMVETLEGKRPLPWEEDAAARRLLPRLQALERSVLTCLARESEGRPSAQAVLGAWTGLFESVTGTTVAEHHAAVVTASMPPSNAEEAAEERPAAAETTASVSAAEEEEAAEEPPAAKERLASEERSAGPVDV